MGKTVFKKKKKQTNGCFYQGQKDKASRSSVYVFINCSLLLTNSRWFLFYWLKLDLKGYYVVFMF